MNTILFQATKLPTQLQKTDNRRQQVTRKKKQKTKDENTKKNNKSPIKIDSPVI